MQPRPIADRAGPLRPNLRVCMRVSPGSERDDQMTDIKPCQLLARCPSRPSPIPGVCTSRPAAAIRVRSQPSAGSLSRRRCQATCTSKPSISIGGDSTLSPGARNRSPLARRPLRSGVCREGCAARAGSAAPSPQRAPQIPGREQAIDLAVRVAPRRDQQMVEGEVGVERKGLADSRMRGNLHVRF